MLNKLTYKVTVNGVTMEVTEGTKISELIPLELPCAGNGRCGKCKVISNGCLSPLSQSEKEHLTDDEIYRGIRLACFTTIMGECQIESIPSVDSDQTVLTDTSILKTSLSPAFCGLGVAIDIGTTTLAASLYDTLGRTLSKAGAINPQHICGADVVSRIEAALNGGSSLLADLIRKAIDDLIITLCDKAKRSASDIDALVITGNTTMLYLLTESSPIGLSRAPFAVDRLFGESLLAKDLKLNSIKSNTQIYIPPCISAFIGADTVCAILASGIDQTDRAGLLADIGTNGEIVLWDGNSLYACSTAAGPAFEGVGISCGMRCMAGAIDRVLIANGRPVSHTIGNTAPLGICGSGIVDAISALLDLELLDSTGLLEDGVAHIEKTVSLTQQDIRAIQLAKASIHAGICTLIQTSGVNIKNIEKLYIAGGFGTYLNTRNAARIGLIPRELIQSAESVGNASLSGAAMLLLNREIKRHANVIAHSVNVVELATSKIFEQHYLSSMLFQ